MSIEWEILADAFRNEVQEYGELLNLFEQQQGAILGRDPDMVLALTDMLETQVKTVDQCLREREAVVRNLALACNQDGDTPLRQLIANAPEPMRLLLLALIEEVNRLVYSTKRRARQNQMLLFRSVDVSQQILRRLNPDEVVQTYSSNGRSNLAVVSASVHSIAKS
jgi:hypothetical protein